MQPGDTIVLAPAGEGRPGDLELDASPGSPTSCRRAREILINDGMVRAAGGATSTARGSTPRVEVGGLISSRQGRQPAGHAPADPVAHRQGPSMTSRSRSEHGVDYVALSFVRRAEDVEDLRERIAAAGLARAVIAKIEKAEAIEHLDAIVRGRPTRSWWRAATSASRSAPPTCRCCRSGSSGSAARRASPVITATQMLESMIAPARADPRRGVRRRQRGARRHVRGDALRRDRRRQVPARGGGDDEPDRARGRAVADLPRGRSRRPRARWDRSSSHAACDMAEDLEAAAIVVPTVSGSTARQVSRYRPRRPIVAASPRSARAAAAGARLGASCRS